MNIFDNQKKDFKQYSTIAGVDEAGRGPLAGPLVVSAVILQDTAYNDVLTDSKKLSEKKRLVLYDWVIANAVDFTIKIVSAKEIDRLNILQATLFGMKSCVADLKVIPDLALFDGNQMPLGLNIESKAVVKGDATYACIAAASILAKVTRDRIMTELHKKYPVYDFLSHKGYPTKKHLEMIEKYGVSDEHRLSYAPCRKIK